ncbi:MAG TPA: hypothetical protein PLB07_08820 [Bacteroidales bacterium]|jgi:hypothetical protein|nr:hypothetical protein [Bacteroidales bacterium]HOT17739.1 hypothetical protein [Bacteroidales bacterium]HQJ14302.1 hypothetical protein [Bacteroidales bacterium]
MKNQRNTCLEKFKNQLSLLAILFLALPFIVVSCDAIEDIDPIATADEYEPNNQLAEAYAIALDTKYNAKISEVTDDDWYKITPSHGSNTYDKVQISVTNVSADLFIHLELYGNDGKSLATHGATTKGQSLIYTVATPGIAFYIRLSGWDGYVNDHQSRGSYSFTVSNMDANDEYAPNHTIETAKPLAFGNSYNGVIVSKAEDDYYKFENPKPGTWNSYTFNLTNVSEDLKVRIRIYGADKSELYSKGAGTAGADLSYTFVSKENVFYLQVLGWDGYINDHCSSGSYTLTPVNNGNDDYEPDDTFDDARPITSYPTGDLTGTILADAVNDNGGDYEFFKVSIANNKKVSWSVKPVAANTELHFHVYEANREYKGYADGADGQTITGSMNNKTGVNSYFYIKLGAYVGDNGNYTISFTETDAD